MKTKCKLEPNCKPEFTRSRLAAYLTALGLSTLALSSQRAQAQNCNELCAPAVNCGVSIQNLATGLGSGTQARVGDNVKINFVFVGRTASSCFVADGPFGNTGTWMAKPNGAGGQIVQKTQGTYQLVVVADKQCNGTAAMNDATCLTYNTSYVVSDADVNKPLSIGSPTELPTTFMNSGPVVFPGTPRQVHFFAATEGTGYKCDTIQPADVSGPAAGRGGTFLIVIHPGIRITKDCVTTCPPPFGNARYGQPIQFQGQVCNTGDVRLTQIVVTDDPVATITISPTTTQGRPFNGTLETNDCVNYTGSYQPSGNLCGPFTDRITVTAVATDNRGVSNSATTTCTVCTAPCIEVIKDCIDTNVLAGSPVRYEFRVRNCGDVPLQNVVAIDDSATPGNAADDVTTQIGNLAIGETKGPFRGTFQTSAADCATNRRLYTNTVVVRGTNLCPPPNTQEVTDSDDCVATVFCPPRICVTKEVACLIATNLCGPFGDSATGFKVVSSTTTNLPAFCYRITVSNCGQVCLTNNQVIDDHFGDLTKDFFANSSEVFCPGQTRSFTFKTELAFDQTNTVNVSGQSVANGQTVSAIDTAEVHVLPASIDCTKLVSSPDDVDGNADDSHVEFPCGSGSHLVSYSVVVTNTGQADLTNIVITDPALSNFCSLPGPFSLAAGTSITIPLCGPMGFECGAGGGGNTNQCANPMLKQAAGCTVLQLGGYKVDMTGPPGCVQGDVCIGPSGKLSMSGEQCITGMIKLDTGATFNKSGSGTVGPVIRTNLSAEINAAIAASMDAAALPCTMTFSALNTAMTITGNGGLNVICVEKVTLGGKIVYLNGTASDRFVINVTGKFALTGGGQIRVAGEVLPKNVLYNIIGTGEQVAFSGGGGGANCCKAVVDGTLIALQRKIALSPGLVNGQLIGGRDISIVSGSSVRCPPGCTPTSFVNTLTVSAELSALQGGTNAFNACVHDLNGLPITVRHQCSATVECR